MDKLAFCIGMASLLFWFACQCPQFIKNWRRGSAEALSAWFLIEWLVGDSTNLVGCLLTHQLTTQRVTAFLFVGMDAFMLSQYTFLHYKNKWRRAKRHKRTMVKASVPSPVSTTEADVSQSTPSSTSYGMVLPLLLTFASVAVFGGSAHALFLSGLPAGTPPTSAITGSSSRVLLAAADEVCNTAPSVPTWAHTTGVALGWVSSVLYLNSRLPQIYKNCKRQSVRGLSWLMFFCAFMGNSTYVTAVVLQTHTLEQWLKVLPWLPGSAGTLVLDACILCQYIIYERRRKRGTLSSEYGTERLLDIDDLEGEGRRKPLKHGVHDIISWTTTPLFGKQSSSAEAGGAGSP